ncbi:MAG: L,D-transpeptidase family protein [Hyphomicrobiaceae bacterium]
MPAGSSKVAQAHHGALTAYYANDAATPLFVTPDGVGERATNALKLIAAAGDWGLRASDFALPAADASPSGTDALAAYEVKLALAAMEYVRQARGGRIVPTDLSHAIDRSPETIAPDTVLKQLATAPSAEIWLRQQHPRHPQFERLRRAFVALRDGRTADEAPEVIAEQEPKKGKSAKSKPKPAAQRPREQRLATLLRNMEMWRWMPRDLGRYHVIVNIPEFVLRVVRNDTVEHEERIIVGKVQNQTPIFSDEMETVVFHPFWGVPNSIKVKELLPGLVRGSNSLARNGLKLQYKGRDVEPSSINWAQTDIRNFHVYQPPGGSNVLGKVKFLFPNSHQVYMHDTPTKHLFASSQRTFSHGCMRVRNPIRFAEVLLAEDKGWSAAKVKAILDSGPQNNNVTLDRKIPVHIAYFTAVVGDDGKVRYLNDVYGHEKVVQMGLDGKAHLIVKKKEDLGTYRAEVIGRLSENSPNWWGGGWGGWDGGSSGGGSSSGGAARSQWARDAFRSD